MQIPILNGTYTDSNSDYRQSYPVNLIPVPMDQGISAGYLRPADGIVQHAIGQGADRGGINWNGECYRVSGTKLIKVSSNAAVTVLGDVGGSGLVTMDYSFDYLAITSGGNLFYWSDAGLEQVTDPDLGAALDFVWVDGYFMTTDGEFLVVTELADPFEVNPLKYGSSEIDPDKVVAVKKLRNEVHAINRYTIEVFDNIGGSGFPFQRIEGAQITKGAVGTHACCLFAESIAFLGGSRNEPATIWIGSGGSTQKLATREIDMILQGYPEYLLEKVSLETRVDDGHISLFVHLPDKCLVYDLLASTSLGEPVWYSLNTNGEYSAKNFTWCYGRWIVGHPNSDKIGALDSSIGSHWGDIVDWEFGTSIIYNEGKGAIFHELELVALTGRSSLSVDDVLYTQYSEDGETWSQPKAIKAGKQGNRSRRLVWFRQGSMHSIRIQRFRGTSNSRLSFSRLEARIEPLAF